VRAATWRTDHREAAESRLLALLKEQQNLKLQPSARFEADSDSDVIQRLKWNAIGAAMRKGLAERSRQRTTS
jgi:hypothetical protein